MRWLDLIQWPAMLVTVAAAWYVASRALVLLQCCLAAMNIRGEQRNS